MLDEKILEPVQYSKLDAPIIPIDKPDSTIRICGDYWLTVNNAARTDTYPIPKIDELFTKLVNGKQFTKLDMSHSYQQLVLSPDSHELVKIDTHRGLYIIIYKNAIWNINSFSRIPANDGQSLSRDSRGHCLPGWSASDRQFKSRAPWQPWAYSSETEESRTASKTKCELLVKCSIWATWSVQSGCRQQRAEWKQSASGQHQWTSRNWERTWYADLLWKFLAKSVYHVRTPPTTTQHFALAVGEKTAESIWTSERKPEVGANSDALWQQQASHPGLRCQPLRSGGSTVTCHGGWFEKANRLCIM